MKPTMKEKLLKERCRVSGDMGLTYWAKLFGEHDRYELGFEWFLNGQWCQGFFSISSPEGLNTL